MPLSNWLITHHLREPGSGTSNNVSPGQALTLDLAKQMVQTHLHSLGIADAHGLRRHESPTESLEGILPSAEHHPPHTTGTYSAGVMVGTIPIYYDYDMDKAQLRVSTLVYHFRHAPLQAAIDRFREHTRASPLLAQMSHVNGDLSMMYEADNRGIYLVRSFHEYAPKNTLKKDIDLLLKLSKQLSTEEGAIASASSLELRPNIPLERLPSSETLALLHTKSTSGDLMASSPNEFAPTGTVTGTSPTTTVALSVSPAGADTSLVATDHATGVPARHHLHLKDIFRRHTSASLTPPSSTETSPGESGAAGVAAGVTILTPVSRMFTESHGVVPTPSTSSLTTAPSTGIAPSHSMATSLVSSGSPSLTTAAVAASPSMPTLLHPKPHNAATKSSLTSPSMLAVPNGGAQSVDRPSPTRVEVPPRASKTAPPPPTASNGVRSQSTEPEHQPSLLGELKREGSGLTGNVSSSNLAVPATTIRKHSVPNASTIIEEKGSFMDSVRKALGGLHSTDENDEGKRNRHATPKLHLDLDTPRPTGVPLKLYSSDTASRARWENQSDA